jgi:hypothetical protein
MKICPKCLCPELATGHMCAGSMKLNEAPGQPPRGSVVEIDHGPQGNEQELREELDSLRAKFDVEVRANASTARLLAESMAKVARLRGSKDPLVALFDEVMERLRVIEGAYVRHEGHVDLEARVTVLEELTLCIVPRLHVLEATLSSAPTGTSELPLCEKEAGCRYVRDHGGLCSPLAQRRTSSGDPSPQTHGGDTHTSVGCRMCEAYEKRRDEKRRDASDALVLARKRLASGIDRYEGGSLSTDLATLEETAIAAHAAGVWFK